MDDLIAIASKLGPAEVDEQLRASLRSAVSDKSWRVRYMVADHFVKVCRSLCHFLFFCSRPPPSQLAEAVGANIVKEEMVTAYVSLLKDNEAEVRSAGAGQLPGASWKRDVALRHTDLEW